MTNRRATIEEDLRHIINFLKEDFKQINDANIFITGGTGFIGKWLLETIISVNKILKLNIKATVLTRSSSTFIEKYPYLSGHDFLTFIDGDICSFSISNTSFTHVIHAATDASAYLNEHNPKQMFDTVIKGTQQVLDFANENSIKKVLFLSSGAVYGQQPWEMEKIDETWNGSLSCTNPVNTYAEAKRAAEMLCSIYVKQFKLNISIARIFALVGPYLPLDTHFALGNFIKDSIEGKPIIVKGNGLPCRSYLYISDLIVWLWKILIHDNSSKIYNTGSDESISIGELAKLVSTTIGNGKYEILGNPDNGWNLGRYVPNTNLIKKDLGLIRTVNLEDAIRKTANWSKENG